MNELQVKTLNIEPAKIEFNHEQLEKELDETLKKYENLVFTEDSTSELRSVRAELNKGKKAIDRYRIDMKNKLNEPVKEFEEKCKKLESKFDEHITSLDKQLKGFVERERKEKRLKIEKIINEVLTETELNENYSSQLAVEDHMLAKSRSMKSIEDELKMKSNNLLVQQQKEESDKRLIESTVKLLNAENDVNLSIESYLSQLEFKSVDDVKNTIEEDIKKELIRQEQEEKKKQESLKRVEQSLEKTNEEFETAFEKVTEVVSEMPTPKIDDSHFKSINNPFENNVPANPFKKCKKEKVYKISGTIEQLKELEAFMDSEWIDWEVVDGE